MKALKGIWIFVTTILAAWGVLITYCAVKRDWANKVRNYEAIKKDYDIDFTVKKKK